MTGQPGLISQSSAQAVLALPDSISYPASPLQAAFPATLNKQLNYFRPQSAVRTSAPSSLLHMPSQTSTYPSSSASAEGATNERNSEAHVHLSSEILRAVLTEYDHIVFTRLSCFDASLGQFAEHLVQVRHEIVGTMNAMLDDYSIAADTKFASSGKKQSRFFQEMKSEMESWRTLLDNSMKSAVKDGLAEAIRTSEVNHDEVLKRMTSMFLLILNQSKQSSDCVCSVNNSLKAVGTTFDSMEAGFNKRLETIENLVLGRTDSAPITASLSKPGLSVNPEASRAVSPLTTPEMDISASGRPNSTSTPDLLARLVQTVEVSREEAHSGKEELAEMLEVAHELQKGRLEILQEQIRDLRSEVGLDDADSDQGQKSPTKDADEVGTMSTPRKYPSLLKRVSNLEQDVQEALRLLRVLVSNLSNAPSHLAETNGQITPGGLERENCKSSPTTNEIQRQPSSEPLDVTMVEQHSDVLEALKTSEDIHLSSISKKGAVADSFETDPIDFHTTSQSPQPDVVDEQHTPAAVRPSLPAWENLSIHVWDDKGSGEEDGDQNEPPSPLSSLSTHFDYPLDTQVEDPTDTSSIFLPTLPPFHEQAGEIRAAPISPSIPELVDHEEMHTDVCYDGSLQDTEALPVTSEEVESTEPVPTPSTPRPELPSESQRPARESLTPTPTNRVPLSPSNRSVRSSSFPSLEELFRSTKPKRAKDFDLFSDSSLTPLSSPASSSYGSDSSDTGSDAEDGDEIDTLPAHREVLPLNGKAGEGSGRPKKKRKLTHGMAEKSKSKSKLHSGDIKWAVRTDDGETFNRQMVQCDLCRNFYHFRCAGLKKGDQILEMDDAPYTCPPCYLRIEKGVNPDSTDTDPQELCRRPDCDVSEAPEFYVVEKVLGRALSETASKKPLVIWLVKWEGYPYDACAWEPTKNLEGSKRLLKDFYRQAKLEGLNWRTNDTVVLKEAFDGGYSL